jgi:hypothetical protein
MNSKARKPKPCQNPRMTPRNKAYVQAPPDQILNARAKRSIEDDRDERKLEEHLKEVWDE